jgi:hypothetical protein
VLDPGKSYDGGSRRPALANIFKSLGIGTKENPTLIPAYVDRAWLSYELKGSQVEFTDTTGRATRLGNSVTEAGFVSSSSCITCHAKASAASDGGKPPALRLPALSVFQNEMSDSGYLQSSFGNPIPQWFNRDGQPPSLQALQTDFVWGFLAANSVKPQNVTGVALTAKAPGRGSFFSVRDRILGELAR